MDGFCWEIPVSLRNQVGAFRDLERLYLMSDVNDLRFRADAENDTLHYSRKVVFRPEVGCER